MLLLPDSFTETNPAVLTPGTPLQTSFTGWEEDWFSVQLTAGVTYQFKITGGGGAGGTLSDVHALYLYGLDPKANAIAVSSWGADGMLISLPFTPEATGIYKLSAIAPSTGSYTIVAEVAAPDDVGSSTSSHALLPIGASVDATTGLPSDRDWFAVTVQAGQLYQFSIEARNGAAHTLYMNLYDSSGKEAVWAGFYSHGTPAMRTGAPTVSGTYYVEVMGVEGVGDYTVRAVALQDDYTMQPGSTGQIASGMTLDGTLEARNDVDWIEFQALAGQAYLLDVIETGGYIYTFQANVHDPRTGFVWPASKYAPFIPTTSGTFRLQISGATPGTYTASMSKPEDDYPNTSTSTVRLGESAQLQGRIDYLMDSDLFKFSVVQGTVYQLDLSTSSAQPASIGLHYSAQHPLQMVASSSAVGSASTTFRATVSGDIDVYLGGQDIASYTLASMVVSVDDHPDYGPGVTALSAGQSLAGVLQTKDDIDTFRVIVEAGKSYVVQVGGALGSAVKVSQNGAPVYPFEASSTKFYASTSGETLVYVKAGGATGAFTVSATSTPHDEFVVRELSHTRYDGGAGFDTVTYIYGGASTYKVLRSGADFTVQSAYADGGAVNTLSGIERIYFQQGEARALDVEGAGIGGAAYRLYQAAFDRTPDRAGVGFWINALDKGMTLRDVAAGFVASNEFKALYGASSSNLEFISRLYANVLNRPGEAAGIDYWVKALDAGYSRVETLVNFSESVENTAAVAQLIGNGFTYLVYG
ncbi:MAG: DUF4214 domain-containing protein [Pseudomonadota bacterium]